jgi:hypothetical protein
VRYEDFSLRVLPETAGDMADQIAAVVTRDRSRMVPVFLNRS